MNSLELCKGCYYDDSDYDCIHCLQCKSQNNYVKTQEEAMKRRNLG